MKADFPGYFSLPEATLKKMWQEGIFAFDANFLLDLYRYSKETRLEVFKALTAIGPRVWVPHQAALEFLENRLKVINDQEKSYETARTDLSKIENQYKASRRHPFISEASFKKLSQIFGSIYEELESQKGEFTNLLVKDDIQDQLTSLLESKIGKAYSPEQLAELHKDGDKRYKEKVPPGYSDAKKEDNRKYGDLIVWQQLIDKAKNEKKPLLFITGDAKEDWWRIFNGKTIGPQPQLVAEMVAKAGVDFHMYAPDRFLEFARTYLSQKVNQEAIDEVKGVQQDAAKLIDNPDAARSPYVYWDSVSPISGTRSNLRTLRNWVAHLEPVLNFWQRGCRA